MGATKESIQDLIDFVDSGQIPMTKLPFSTNSSKYLDKGFDYVVNLGGYINHQLFKDGGRNLIDTHFITIQNLVEVLPRNKLKRFVQIGSSDEYGNAPAPQNEKMREQPISPYSLAKVASTHFLQMLHKMNRWIILYLL